MQDSTIFLRASAPPGGVISKVSVEVNGEKEEEYRPGFSMESLLQKTQETGEAEGPRGYGSG